MAEEKEHAVRATFVVQGLDEELLTIEFEGEEGLSRLFSFSIHLASLSNAIPLSKVVGQTGVLAINGLQGTRYVHGTGRHGDPFNRREGVGVLGWMPIRTW